MLCPVCVVCGAVGWRRAESPASISIVGLRAPSWIPVDYIQRAQEIVDRSDRLQPGIKIEDVFVIFSSLK